MLRKAWTVFAEAFFVEAREVGIDAKRFSVPSCLDFIANQGALTMTPMPPHRPGNTCLRCRHFGGFRDICILPIRSSVPLNSSGSPGDPTFGAVQNLQTVQDAVGPFQNFPAFIHSNI